MKFSELKQQWGAFRFYALCILALSMAIYLGFSWGNADNIQQKQHISQLKQTLDNVQNENASLSKQLNILGVELEVVKVAQQLIKQDIQQGMQRESELRNELGFYQQVMAPELKPKGFVIEAFDVEAGLSPGHFRFELVMMQQEKIKNTITGDVAVTIVGSQDGQPKIMSLSELMDKEAKPLTFSFRYFQVLSGELRLPDNFKAEKVLLHAKIYQFKRKRGSLDKSFDWQLNSLDTQ